MRPEIPWDKVEWGTVPAGVGSILTGVSLLIAALAYRHARADARKSQAKQVSAWLEGLDSRKGSVRLAARNASDLPVYQLTIRSDGVEIIDTKYLAVLGPDGDWESSQGYMYLALIQAWKKAGPVPYAAQPSISFRDAAGRCWERTSDGRLKARRSWLHQRRWKREFAEKMAPPAAVDLDDDD
ncbi:hypothetical protein [Micromonospora sp. NPDC049799]|uniref:hypothetical protein n=1 Tax=Micromonospora sp. NPDC049799 TaxID=3154741 RepID=UPI00340290C9